MEGGHNALRRAHEDIADPLYAAMSGGNGETTAADPAEYAQSTSGAPNAAALPNPWGGPATPVAPAPVAQPAGGATATPAPALGTPMAGAPAGPNPMAAMMQQMM